MEFREGGGPAYQRHSKKGFMNPLRVYVFCAQGATNITKTVHFTFILCLVNHMTLADSSILANFFCQ